MRRAFTSRTRPFIDTGRIRRRQVQLVSAVCGAGGGDFRVLPAVLLPSPSLPSTAIATRNSHFSSSSKGSRSPPPTKRKEDPFHVLGLPHGSSYQQAKRAFLKLALEHHPDKQQQDDSTSGSNTTTADFIRIRQAFEVIREGSEGEAIVTNQNQWTPEEFHDFMEEQQNDFLTFKMDTKTRKEVIETFENLSPGGLDRGGSWLMARMLAEREKSTLVDCVVPTPKQIESSRVQRRRRR